MGMLIRGRQRDTPLLPLADASGRREANLANARQRSCVAAHVSRLLGWWRRQRLARRRERRRAGSRAQARGDGIHPRLRGRPVGSADAKRHVREVRRGDDQGGAERHLQPQRAHHDVCSHGGTSAWHGHPVSGRGVAVRLHVVWIPRVVGGRSPDHRAHPVDLGARFARRLTATRVSSACAAALDLASLRPAARSACSTPPAEAQRLARTDQTFAESPCVVEKNASRSFPIASRPM
jgi:hypothetical protein